MRDFANLPKSDLPMPGPVNRPPEPPAPPPPAPPPPPRGFFVNAWGGLSTCIEHSPPDARDEDMLKRDAGGYCPGSYADRLRAETRERIIDREADQAENEAMDRLDPDPERVYIGCDYGSESTENDWGVFALRISGVPAIGGTPPGYDALASMAGVGNGMQMFAAPPTAGEVLQALNKGAARMQANVNRDYADVCAATPATRELIQRLANPAVPATRELVQQLANVNRDCDGSLAPGHGMYLGEAARVELRSPPTAEEILQMMARARAVLDATMVPRTRLVYLDGDWGDVDPV